jgi:hypothetical protein
VNLMSDLWLSGLKKTMADAESTSNYWLQKNIPKKTQYCSRGQEKHVSDKMTKSREQQL